MNRQIDTLKREFKKADQTVLPWKTFKKLFHKTNLNEQETASRAEFLRNICTDDNAFLAFVVFLRKSMNYVKEGRLSKDAFCDMMVDTAVFVNQVGSAKWNELGYKLASIREVSTFVRQVDIDLWRSYPHGDQEYPVPPEERAQPNDNVMDSDDDAAKISDAEETEQNDYNQHDRRNNQSKLPASHSKNDHSNNEKVPLGMATYTDERRQKKVVAPTVDGVIAVVKAAAECDRLTSEAKTKENITATQRASAETEKARIEGQESRLTEQERQKTFRVEGDESRQTEKERRKTIDCQHNANMAEINAKNDQYRLQIQLAQLQLNASSQPAAQPQPITPANQFVSPSPRKRKSDAVETPCSTASKRGPPCKFETICEFRTQESVPMSFVDRTAISSRLMDGCSSSFVKNGKPRTFPFNNRKATGQRWHCSCIDEANSPGRFPAEIRIVRVCEGESGVWWAIQRNIKHMVHANGHLIEPHVP